MKSPKKKITTLYEDIRQIVEGSKEENPDLAAFCRDHSKPILLPDQKPVFDNVSLDQFLGIFDMAANHYFLPPKQMFRFACHFKLRFQNTISLLLKSSWEIYFSEMIGYGPDSGINLMDELKNQKQVEKYLPGFQTSNKEIYNLLRQASCESCESGESPARITVNSIIKALLKEYNFLAENRYADKLFPEKEHTEDAILAKATSAQKKEYLKLKTLWKTRGSDFEDKLLLLEQKKRLNLNAEDNYYRTFGKLELIKAELGYRKQKYEKLLELKKQYPTLGCRVLLKMAIELITETERKNNELRNKYARSLNRIEGLMVKGDNKDHDVDLFDYEDACKKVLKKLYFLLHPDQYTHCELSEEVKNSLSELWLELMKTSEEQFKSFTSGLLLYTHPDYYRLCSLLKRTCDILQKDMDDLEIADQLEILIKQGTSIQKLIEFLKQDLENLQLHLSNLELKQFEYANDKQAQIYWEAQLDPEAHQDKLESVIAAAKEEICRLKENISQAFKKAVV